MLGRDSAQCVEPAPVHGRAPLHRSPRSRETECLARTGLCCHFSLDLALRVRAVSLIHVWVATVPCCPIASVRKRLQASGIERSRSSKAKKQRSEEAAKRRIDTFLAVSTPFSALFQATLQTIFTPFLLARLCLGALCRIRDADCELCHL